MIRDAPVVEDRNQEIRQLLIDWIAERDTIRTSDVFEPTWRLVPQSATEAHLASVAERESERIAGDARARGVAGTAVSGGRDPPGLAYCRHRCRPKAIPCDWRSSRPTISTARSSPRPCLGRGRTIGGAATLAAYVGPVEARTREPRSISTAAIRCRAP